MSNYFISYTGNRYRKKTYIIPEVSVISNTTSRDNLVSHINDNDNPLNMEIWRATEKFLPLTYRVSHPVVLSSWVIGSDNRFYEVFEGIYNVTEEELHLKLKVQKQYGQ